MNKAIVMKNPKKIRNLKKRNSLRKKRNKKL